MITPTVFYQQMKKWVSSDDTRPIFQHIYFDGDRAVATNVHRMAVVKNRPSDAHFETIEGARAEEVGKYPDFERAIPPLEKAKWMYEIEFKLFAAKYFFAQWKNIMDCVKKIVKSNKYGSFALQKQGCTLYAYAVGNNGVRMKIVLLDNMEPTSKNEDWYAGFNAAYIADAIEFLRVTEPLEFRMYVAPSDIICFETEELLLVITPVRLKKDGDTQALVDFVESEIQKENLLAQMTEAETDDDNDIF